jgi:hypothetical protein
MRITPSWTALTGVPIGLPDALATRVHGQSARENVGFIKLVISKV